MERLEKLEEDLRQIEERQTDFHALEPLLGNVDSVLRFDSNSALYRKKLADVSAKAEAVRKYAVSLQAKVALFTNSADESVRELAKKRERDLRALESKVSSIESTYKALKGEGGVVANRIKSELEAERAAFHSTFAEKLRLEAELVTDHLRKDKEQTRADVEAVKEAVKVTTRDNAAYAKKAADGLKTALPKEARTPEAIEEGKKTVLEEVKTKVTASIAEVKGGIDKQALAVVEKLRSDVANVTAGIREMREALPLPDAGDRVDRHFKNVRAWLEDLYPSLAVQARNVAQAQTTLEAKLKKVKDKTLTEELKTTLSDADREMEGFTASLSSLESQFQTCVTGLEASFSHLATVKLPAARADILSRFRQELALKRPLTEKAVSAAKARQGPIAALCNKLRALPPPAAVEEPKPEEAKAPEDAKSSEDAKAPEEAKDSGKKHSSKKESAKKDSAKPAKTSSKE